MSDLVDDEQEVTDVNGNIPADIRVEDYVTHRTLPDPVEIDSDQVAF